MLGTFGGVYAQPAGRSPEFHRASAWSEEIELTVESWRQPTKKTRSGRWLVLVGPDGSGKSTLATLIVSSDAKHALHLHWRPGVLPRLGSLVGRTEGDVSQPHSKEPHSPLLSTAMVLYYWLDFFLGSWIRIRPFCKKGGHVIMERGWWDFGIDPLRYRLKIDRRWIELLGRLLPKPDAVVILETRAQTLFDRKQELPEEELERQTQGWRDTRLPPSVPRFYLDAAKEPTSNAIVVEQWMNTGEPEDESRTRAMASEGDWARLPSRASARWILPRRSRQLARGGLSIYHPVTNRGLVAWNAARGLAALGGFKLLSGSHHLPAQVEACLSDLLAATDDIAVARANHPGRFVALVLDPSGRPKLFAKIVDDDAGRVALAKERQSIETFGPQLKRPLEAPRILAHSDDCLILEPIKWKARANAWWLPPEVAAALGGFHASAQGNGSSSGNAHGDFAPWNLLRTEEGWMVIDWENARSGFPPFYDLWHYVVQSHGLLRRPSMGEIGSGLSGEGWIGEAASRYAAAAGLKDADVRPSFFDYLSKSEELLDLSTHDGVRGRDIRDRLRRELSGHS